MVDAPFPIRKLKSSSIGQREDGRPVWDFLVLLAWVLMLIVLGGDWTLSNLDHYWWLYNSTGTRHS